MLAPSRNSCLSVGRSVNAGALSFSPSLGIKSCSRNFHSALAAASQEMQAVVRLNDPDAIVWRGGSRRSDFGHTAGPPRFCSFQVLQCLRLMTSCSRLSSPFRIFSVLGFSFCCGARVNCTLRVVHPELTASFAVPQMPQPTS